MPCPGDAIRADRAVTGRFGKELQGSYVLVPFEVPAGTTAVVRRGRMQVGCRAAGTDLRTCAVRVVRRGVEIASGSAPVTGGRAMVHAGLNARGVRLLPGRRGRTPVTVEVAAVDREGRTATVTPRTRLR